MEAALEMLAGFFKQSENLDNNESFKKIKDVLKYNGMETEELIHAYYLERLQGQKTLADAHEGMLTVRAQFVNYTLRVEILNARNLVAHDKNGKHPVIHWSKLYLLLLPSIMRIVSPCPRFH